MGYFILNEEETVKGLLETSIANIELFLKSGKGYEYLLTDFAMPYLKKAIELKQKAQDENTKDIKKIDSVAIPGSYAYAEVAYSDGKEDQVDMLTLFRHLLKRIDRLERQQSQKSH